MTDVTDQPGATAAGQDATQGAAGATPPASWWEGERFSAEDRAYLTARGLTVEDPLDALPKVVQAHRHAESRLGRPAEQIMDRPKKDQPLAEWMRGQKDIFGLPETAEGYTIERPASLPEDLPWDEGLAKAAQAAAHEQGLTPAQLNAMVGIYANHIAAFDKAAKDGQAAANATMLADLQKDWGDQTPANITRAKQAAQLIGQEAGLDPAAIEAISATLHEKTGDAGVIKLFAAIGRMMGEDSMVRPGGAALDGVAVTPAQARAELAKLQSPGGEYYEATFQQDRRKLAELAPRVERLSKLAAGG